MGSFKKSLRGGREEEKQKIDQIAAFPIIFVIVLLLLLKCVILLLIVLNLVEDMQLLVTSLWDKS